MFARAAKSWDIDCVRVATPVVPANSNDNHVNRPLADAARRPSRQGLACHWRVSPVTGKPECHWEIEHAAELPQRSDAPGSAKAQPKSRNVLASIREF
jgi:hypothetical protein